MARIKGWKDVDCHELFEVRFGKVIVCSHVWKFSLPSSNIITRSRIRCTSPLGEDTSRMRLRINVHMRYVLLALSGENLVSAILEIIWTIIIWVDHEDGGTLCSSKSSKVCGMTPSWNS